VARMGHQSLGKAFLIQLELGFYLVGENRSQR